MVNISAKNFATVSFKANVMPEKQAKHIDNILHSGKSVDIFCHTLSDEDTFNSATTFYNYLKDQGIQPRIIVSGGQSNYNYDTQKYNILQAKDVTETTQKADTALCVDFSSKDRLSNNVYKHLLKYKSDKIVGIDHHDDKIKLHPSYNQITKSYEKNQVPDLKPKNYYIDSSARANCAIVYRFFEALGITPNKEEAKAMYTGLCDDTGKNSTDLDKNTKEVKSKLSSNIPFFDKLDILKHFTKKTIFTSAENKFQKSLDKKVQYSKNGKFAYIQIDENDKEWQNLNNNYTKAYRILSDYRKNAIKSNGVEAFAVFHPTEDAQLYKMSITSNNDFAKQIVDEAKKNDNKIIAGGHIDRCGGTITTNDETERQKWVKTFINSAETVFS